jgi:hypothetical protein
MVNYEKSAIDVDDDVANSSPMKPVGKRRQGDSASDLDFAAERESDGDDDSDFGGQVDPRELEPQTADRSKEILSNSGIPVKGNAKKSISTPSKTSPSKKVTRRNTITLHPLGKSSKKQQGSAVISSKSAKVTSSVNSKATPIPVKRQKPQTVPAKKLPVTILPKTKEVTGVKQSVPSQSLSATQNNADVDRPASFVNPTSTASKQVSSAEKSSHTSDLPLLNSLADAVNGHQKMPRNPANTHSQSQIPHTPQFSQAKTAPSESGLFSIPNNLPLASTGKVPSPQSPVSKTLKPNINQMGLGPKPRPIIPPPYQRMEFNLKDEMAALHSRVKRSSRAIIVKPANKFT